MFYRMSANQALHQGENLLVGKFRNFCQRVTAERGEKRHAVPRISYEVVVF